MKKEISLRSTQNISNNTTNTKFPIRLKIMNIFIVLKKLKNHIKSKKFSTISIITSSFSKIILFILTLTVILTLYYFYINFFIVPYFESTKPGLTIEFWHDEKWEDSKYRKGVLIFFTFHLLFILFFISVLKAIFCNPGALSTKYMDLYSLSNFLRVLFNYIIHFKDKKYKLSIEGNNKDVYSIVKELVSMEKDVNSALELYNSANIYNSIDVTFKKGGGIASDLDNDLDFHDVAGNITKDLIEDIIEPFEQKIEEIINLDQEYKHFNDLKFIYEGKKIKRICQFCLLKKPDRTHHCRICRRCLLKMDHHCHFLSSCIGYNNYKFFLLVLFYAISLLTYMIVTLIESLKFYINEYGDRLYLTVFISVYTFIILFDGLLIYFLGMHIGYISRNNTTIEVVEKSEKDKTFKDVYDKGFLKNIQSILGTNCLFWFFPTDPCLNLTGYEFEVNYDPNKK